ncbi:MAG: mannose-1-phosphate guanylyltransferase, partial [Pseudomonadota bacterium]
MTASIQNGADHAPARHPMIHPVIMCGGSGSRLWPVSRRAYPKQFAALFEGGSLFQRTLQRMQGERFAAPWMMTGSPFRFIVAEQADDIGVEPGRIVIEPEGRNTAPAIATAALMLAEDDPDGLMLVLPSDHVLSDVPAFHAAVEHAAEAAATGALVTFGITPTAPETGYGYIEIEGTAADPDEAPARPFIRFVEKPDAARAAEMVASGRYLWNSGMFMFRAGALIAAMETHAPDVLTACRAAIAEGREDLCFYRLGDKGYAQNPNISIDFAVMERVQGSVVPLSCGWNDLGSWATVWSESMPDEDGVATSSGAIALECTDTLLRSDDESIRLVGLGLDGVVAVAT